MRIKERKNIWQMLNILISPWDSLSEYDLKFMEINLASFPGGISVA
jgi:hypothetical protein